MDLQSYLTANTQNLSDEEKKALGLTNPVKADGTPDTEPKGVIPKSYSINELYEMVNPATGRRYSIPFLSPADPDYKAKYADAMRTMIEDPEVFQKLLTGE